LSTMKKGLLTLLILVLVLPLFLESDVSGYELTKLQQREFSFKPGQLLSIRLQSGEIRIRPGMEGKSVVRIKKWVEASTRRRAEERLAQLTLDFSPTDSGVEIRQMDRSSRMPLSGLLRSAGLVRTENSKISLEILLPRRASVQVVQRDGTVRLDSLQGNVDIKLVQGRLRLRRLVADKLDLRLGNVDARLLGVRGSEEGELYVTAELKRGKLVLRRCRIYRLMVHANEGDVYLIGNELVRGDVRTESGDIFLRPSLRRSEKLICQSKSGDFFIKLSVRPVCRLIAETGLGRIFSPYNWPVARSGGGETLRLLNAKQNPEIRLTSELGDMFIQPLRNGR